MKPLIYHCPICGNVITKLIDSGVTPECCGSPMIELHAGESDGKDEYHKPHVEPLGGCVFRVSVGYEPHPTVREHHIEFLLVETWRGFEVRYLPVGEAALSTFYLDDTPVAFYAYCNLHGLWMTPSPKTPRLAE